MVINYLKSIELKWLLMSWPVLNIYVLRNSERDFCFTSYSQYNYLVHRFSTIVHCELKSYIILFIELKPNTDWYYKFYTCSTIAKNNWYYRCGLLLTLSNRHANLLLKFLNFDTNWDTKSEQALNWFIIFPIYTKLVINNKIIKVTRIILRKYLARKRY